MSLCGLLVCVCSYFLSLCGCFIVVVHLFVGVLCVCDVV